MSERCSASSAVDLPGEPGRQRTVSVDDGRTLSYAEYGSVDGRPVLFLHGTPGSRCFGRLFDTAARNRGVRLLAPDRPGYGNSSPWPERTLVDTGAVLEVVLEDAGISRADIVGFSGGGPHALALAATHSDLVGEVDIVSGTAPPSFSPSPPWTHRLLGALAMSTPTILSGLFRLQSWLVSRSAPSLVVSQYTTADEREALTAGEAELIKQDFLEAVIPPRGVITESALFTTDWDIPLADVDRSIRLWHGAEDENVPIDAARQLVDSIPNARLEIDATGGHLTTLLRRRGRLLD
ncbi:alpha/beta fold hydrolase [Natrialba sp. SSL1]|uniref:alpha/beta fold hydrolase n=1 Tax=Natrialba sp. SSL1 TaxID=1869245 RepID=UPI0008F94C83|nr:alpha/beta hydrolase [Natrialba sp. SSL1]OIB56434.1 hypothetical protein BBD46_17545 [Natrialba sp. SSL1]